MPRFTPVTSSGDSAAQAMGQRALESLPHRRADGGADDGLREADGVARAAFLSQGADADFLALVGLAAREFRQFAL